MVRTSLVVIALVCLASLSHASQGPRAKAPAVTSAAAPATAVININTASATDLERLPGIGAKTANKIVEYRQKNGPFKKVEELMNVQGIGEKNFLKLRAQISVGSAGAQKVDHGNAQAQ